MKRILSFMLVFAMVMSLSSVPVFAAGTITSTDEGSNSASQSVTADYTPAIEATWGTAQNQSSSGSLTDAIAAAKDDSSITYIQLQKDLNITNKIDIAGGTFTFDFNGKTIALADDSSDYEAIYVHETSSKVTFTDSASKGGVEATNKGTCVYIEYGSTVVFNGGTYQGIIGMMVYSSTVTINNGDFVGTGDNLADGIRCMNDATMTINGGTFQGTRSAITNYGNLTITGGTFSEGTEGHIYYRCVSPFSPNKLDLSGFTGKITKLTVTVVTAIDAIGDDNIKLPSGYGMSEDGSNVVTSLKADKKYSIISTTGESQDAIITSVSVKVGSETYTSGNVTLTPDSGSVTIEVSGTDFSKLDDSDNKLLCADGSFVGVSEASGWTVDAANNTASKTFALSTFQNCTTAFEIKYSNEGDVSDKYQGSGIYIVYQNETVSVGITWGAMNFTYSDEQVDNSDKGWTCETGANTVKVENKGTESIVAGISYKQADDYTAISGTFDKASETIANGGNVTFTLTLSGKPDAALSGTNIGTVTVTIKKEGSFDVTTEEDLNIMLSWLTAKLNAGATDIVLNLSDTPWIGDVGPEATYIVLKINETIKQSDAVDGTIHLTVSGAEAAGVWPGYSGNTKLKTITLPDATIFCSECFNNCTNLTAVYAPSVTKIVGMPFDGCDNLTTLELTATGSFTFKNDLSTSWNSGTSNIDLKLNVDKQSDVVQNQDGTGTWNGNTFKSITFVDSND